MRSFKFLYLLLFAFAFSGCNQNKNSGTGSSNSSSDMSDKLDPAGFQALLAKTPDAQLIDVNTPDEFAKGHLKNAKNIDISSDEFSLNALALDKGKSVFLYCAGDIRSAKAGDFLRSNGYKEVYELDGGLLKWKAAKLPVEGESESGISNMTSEEFNAKIKSDKLVLVDFNATWCGPCKMLSPILEDLAKQYSSKVELVKIDVDENRNLANSMKIESLPTMVLYKNGVKTWMKIGMTERDQIENELKKNF